MLKNLILAIVALVTLATLTLFLTLWHLSPGITPTAKNPLKISVAHNLLLGGQLQFVTLHGNDISKPLLLFIHGGPGDPIAPQLAFYNANLRDNFVVVTWDQRGAGRSFDPTMDPVKMTAEQIVLDGDELLTWLSDNFPGKPILIAGHSWGSFIGIRLAKLSPDKLCAYVGIGQVSDQGESERQSYRWVLGVAQGQLNETAVSELQDIGEPVGGRYESGIEGLMTQRKWVREFGGAAWGLDNLDTLWMFAKPIFLYPEYNLRQKFQYLEGEVYSMQFLEESLFDFDLMSEVSDLQIPVTIIQGSHDHQTETELARTYYQQLSAPNKEWVEFTNAAHLVPFEDPVAFAKQLTRVSETHCSTKRAPEKNPGTQSQTP